MLCLRILFLLDSSNDVCCFGFESLSVTSRTRLLSLNVVVFVATRAAGFGFPNRKENDVNTNLE